MPGSGPVPEQVLGVVLLAGKVMGHAHKSVPSVWPAMLWAGAHKLQHHAVAQSHAEACCQTKCCKQLAYGSHAVCMSAAWTTAAQAPIAQPAVLRHQNEYTAEDCQVKTSTFVRQANSMAAGELKMCVRLLHPAKQHN